MGRKKNNKPSTARVASPAESMEKLQALAAEYKDLPISAVKKAWKAAFTSINPYVQNRRVQAVSTLPADYGKDKVADMLIAPNSNEQQLRQVGHALEWTAYPLFHARQVYSNLLSYHNYVYPEYLSDADAKRPDFMREWQLVDKLRKAFDIKATAHEIAGQAIQEGKVFYYPRVDVDKPHNKVNAAFLQQLPSDYVKIVGFNNVSKYTLAFNLMYFTNPGTSPEQFGDLFLPYMADFRSVVKPNRGPIFASGNAVLDLHAFMDSDIAGRVGAPDAYIQQGGKAYYWVTLPVDKVFTFEVDDASRTVASPLAGLYLALVQMAQYEQIQLELVQNPLIALFTGEIPYNTKAGERSDKDFYSLSHAGMVMFEELWYQMLANANTGGIGWFTAPVENIKMHQLAEAPSATKISSAGYSYAMSKAGLSGIVPTTEDPKSGLARISMEIESKFAECIYRDYRRMFLAVLRGLNLKYSWGFEMFGTLAADKDRMEAARQGMTLGILPQTLVYLAMNDMSPLDDMSISGAIVASGLLEKRIPLATSYTASNGGNPQAAHDNNPGGRPASNGEVTSEGQEKDIDTYGE